ncbi:hypothetical protein SALBM217S_01366 [Streptomyces griseoloalbus]
MTSGAGGRVAEPVGGGVLLWPLSWGGSRRPPVLPPSRPSCSCSASAESLGPALSVSPVPEPSRPVPGDVEGGGGAVGRRGGAAVPLAVVRLVARWPGQQGLERGDVLVYGVEHGRDLLTDVPELHGEPVAQVAQVSRWAWEGGERLDGAEGVPGCARRPRGAAGGPPRRRAACRTGAADLAQRLVVEGADGAVALHQPAGLAEPGGGLVEVDPASSSPSARVGFSSPLPSPLLPSPPPPSPLPFPTSTSHVPCPFARPFGALLPPCAPLLLPPAPLSSPFPRSSAAPPARAWPVRSRRAHASFFLAPAPPLLRAWAASPASLFLLRPPLSASSPGSGSPGPPPRAPPCPGLFPPGRLVPRALASPFPRWLSSCAAPVPPALRAPALPL